MRHHPTSIESLTVPDKVVKEVIDGEAVVLNLLTGRYHLLNKTATRMWELMQTHGNTPALRAALLEVYDVAPADLEADLAKTLRDLEDIGLITRCHGD